MPKQKITIWVEEDAAQRLKNLAAVEDLTLSEYGATLLARGVAQRSDELVLDLAGARIERAVKKEVGAMSDRLAKIIVQAAMEAGTSRRLHLNQIAQQAGPETAQALNRTAAAETRERLRTPSAAVKDLLGLEDAP
ncbi:hypothetical protein [Deinococcus marmoris]|uniref:hypothetical protein n=1 Tax=Deinococcus marmoris TaxID=249408 RepID=UPI00049764D5|nr:hypothetical protein [Deinococcus marmoris]